MALANQYLRHSFPAWAAFGIGLLLTVLASLQVKLSIDREAATRFAFVCDQVVIKIQERVRAYELIIRGGAGLFAASNSVTRQDWRSYVETSRAGLNVPGVQGIGFAQVIPSDQLAGHIARIRGEGFPDYTVHPPGARAFYTSIIFLEPFRDPNLRTFGYDMFSEPVRRAAMEQARDTGEAALSGKVGLVQATGMDVQAGALLYVPVYRRGAPVESVEHRREALIGWTYIPFFVKELLSGILLDWEDQVGKVADMHIYDGSEASEANLLFDSKGPGTPLLLSPFRQQRSIDFHGHVWRLEFDQAAMQIGNRYAAAWTTLIGGLVLSGVLFALVLSMLDARVNATREEATQATSEYTRSLIEVSQDPLVMISKEGKITDVNVATERVTGRRREELIGTDFTTYFTEPERAREGYRQVFSEGLIVDYPLAIRHLSGKVTDVLYNANVYRDAKGNVLGVFAAARDITERKAIQEKLLQANAELERRVEQRTSELARSNAELEQFAYVTSHDLQEPLRMVIGYVQLLDKRLADKLDGDTREFMDFAVDGAKRMQGLIQDILAYSRISTQGQPLEKVDSAGALKEALALLAGRIAETGAEITTQPLPMVMADRTQLVQLFQNLISNALKFCTDPAPRVQIEARHEAGWWRFAVTDNGIGIAPEYRDQLFVIFKRLHTRREYPGTGIGLAICKRIIKRHGGDIGIESAAGGGSVFWFTLPEEKSP